MAFETAALSRSPEKRDLALSLGADRFVDTDETDPPEALSSMDGAQVVPVTAPSAETPSRAWSAGWAGTARSSPSASPTSPPR